MSRVTVSIVNWNTRDQLRRCLVALMEARTSVDLDIRVVDNCSGDGSAGMVAEEFPDVWLLRSTTNLGFAGGNNSALQEPIGEFVLILNPDVQATGDAISALIRFLNENADAGAVSPLLVGADGTSHDHLYRRFPTRMQVALFWTVLYNVTIRVGWLRRRYFEHDLRGDEPLLIDQLPGAAMLVRSSVVRSVGLMDPDYFVWFEDVDWCYRARMEGHQLYVLPHVRVRHEGGASFQGWNKHRRLHQFYRTFFRFLCKHRLEGLRRFAGAVLILDLYLKEMKQRALGGSGPRSGASLASTRREIRQVVARHRAGELVCFTDAGPSSVAL